MSKKQATFGVNNEFIFGFVLIQKCLQNHVLNKLNLINRYYAILLTERGN